MADQNPAQQEREEKNCAEPLAEAQSGPRLDKSAGKVL
jgi:hypothetical protein